MTEQEIVKEIKRLFARHPHRNIQTDQEAKAAFEKDSRELFGKTGVSVQKWLELKGKAGFPADLVI